MNINLVTFRTRLSEGGIQNTGYLLASSFSERQSVKLCLLTDAASICPKNVKCLKIGSDKHGIVFRARLFFNLLKHKADINFCLHWTAAVPCMIYRFITHTPYSVMVYGNEIMQPNRKSLLKQPRQILRRSVLNHASCIFACSEYTKQLCAQCCKNEKITVIHPPVHFVEMPLSDARHTFCIFSVGRHVERKGFQDVIRAMPLLRQIYPQIRYRLAGDGPYHAELVRLVGELDVSDCVDLLGKITEEQKQQELQNCDVFIMTSHTDEEHSEVEGFGVCYLEANAYGKWVIARDTGGVSDAVINGTTGRLLSDSEPATICHAVEEYYLMLHPDVQKMREWAEAHKPETIARQYIDSLKVYEE